MNENDKGGGGRRRSSRRRGGRSGGKQQDRGEGLQKQTVASSRMGEERPSPTDRASRPRSERARRGDRRSGQGDQQSRRGTGERASGERALGDRASGERQISGTFDKVKNRAQYPDRPRWTPPRLAPPVLPKPECPRCGRPIEDLAAAINDRESGEPTHFDCVIERIAEGESLGEGDKVIYIGGGRFGVVHFENPNDPKRFEIKKMLQWEEKEKRSPWRRDVADQYSAT